LKAVKEKKTNNMQSKPIKITADFSTEILIARRTWSEVFQALNENNFNPAKLLFKIDGTIRVFHDKQKLKQYMTTKLTLQKILQGILHIENETKQNHERTGKNHRRRKDKESESNINSVAHNQTLKQKKTTKCQESPHTYQY
jgi:hypothetical protein